MNSALIRAEEKHPVRDQCSAEGASELAVVEGRIGISGQVERITSAEEIVRDEAEQASMKSVRAGTGNDVIH